ncbi:MAG: hypothetical protein GY874_22560 [Desulfobacteraceae bacterium]|nr:hypothetical protein [Desulfobacteraceae bacterium]
MKKISYKNEYISSLLVLKNFINLMSQYSNVRIFAFGLEKFTDDLRLYKDPSHYHIEVNNYIVNAISKNKNKLTSKNIENYLVTFDKKISRYRLSDKWNPKNAGPISKTGKTISTMEAEKMISK